jgi:subtilisin-like proprotein convertase family protein
MGAWGLPGGSGAGVKIIDIEYSWNTAHEDLSKAAGALIPNGTPQDPFPEDNQNHGTAVLGEIVADRNGFGVTGIAYGASLGLVNAYRQVNQYVLAEAIDLARTNTSAGDIILIEQQTLGPQGSWCSAPAADNYVPVEYWQAYFDAIQTATAAGRIVVEAAGNGGCNLDNPAYGNRFNRANRDSGAIIVGAAAAPGCTAPPRSRLDFPNWWGSSYGTRVDVQGWGECVVTAGYGGLQGGANRNVWYTGAFSGTSSASPMVAGAAAIVQSVRLARGVATLSPLEMRDWLTANGTPQNMTVPGNIGPLPNLATADPGTPTPTPTPGTPTPTPTPTGPAGCNTYTSADVPKSILDWTTVTSTLNVGSSFTLADVNAGPLNIAHTWDSDLDVFLISPLGTRVELFTEVGGSGDNFTNTVLDDECATSIASGAAPFTGCYRPEGSLSALDGQGSAGVWTLEITDGASGDTGTLQSWQLELCGAVCPGDADCDGVPDSTDNCPSVYNPGQENSDSGPPPSGTGAIGNGASILGDDITIANGDALGDACDPDMDNDGIPNASDSDPGGDITYDDNNNGIPCFAPDIDPAVPADTGPSWDADCNGVLDGVEAICPLAVNPTGDTDGDGLKNTWEVCKWGTNPNIVDSDSDGAGDCQEALDSNGNGTFDFGGDVLNMAKAALLPAGTGAGKFGRDGDFDLNGVGGIGFGDDVLNAARMAFGLLPCQ